MNADFDDESEPNSSRLASPMATPRRSGITALLPCVPASSSAADAGPQPPWLVSALRCLQPCNDPQMRYAIRRDDAEALVALLNSRRCFGIGRTDVNVALDGADGSALHLAASDASASMGSAKEISAHSDAQLGAYLRAQVLGGLSVPLTYPSAPLGVDEKEKPLWGAVAGEKDTSSEKDKDKPGAGGGKGGVRAPPAPVPPEVMHRLLTPELLRAYDESLP
ncbi:hypothetical protein Ctob_009545 [Chrysochromulina tobinii]|uniref:Uncharacterized protein n=1 Tax=Chrysochromulina tobinii TaxID=1460289 RepID=A0A0M0JZI5_9EUKA|nr:hypothetical protein Ctob_009545 [Chrysochromulina tobinii]|eukprot:KOO31964.1 hypothetical protein Ctob_009545 [Chrysochromulina sp. CCMP291]